MTNMQLRMADGYATTCDQADDNNWIKKSKISLLRKQKEKHKSKTQK